MIDTDKRARLRAVNAGLVEACSRYADIAEFALPKFDWARSPLDQQAITALNREPILPSVRGVIAASKGGDA